MVVRLLKTATHQEPELQTQVVVALKQLRHLAVVILTPPLVMLHQVKLHLTQVLLAAAQVLLQILPHYHPHLVQVLVVVLVVVPEI
jgi:hypothetical protein